MSTPANNIGYVHAQPDSTTSWLICGIAFVINALPVGILRTYGLLYVIFIEMYGVPRSQASWPLSLVNSMLYLAGPTAGILASHFQLRVLILIGILMSALGVGLSFFATSIFQISITFGVIQGTGVGIVNMLVPVLLNQYFIKFRTTAAGIAMAGNTIGAFLLPPLVSWILDKYTIEDAYLLITGIILQALPLAILMRPPIRSQKKKWRLLSVLARRRAGTAGLTKPLIASKIKIAPSAHPLATSKSLRPVAKPLPRCSCTPDPPLAFLSAKAIIKYSAMPEVKHEDLNIAFIDDDADESPRPLGLEFKPEIKCTCDRYGGSAEMRSRIELTNKMREIVKSRKTSEPTFETGWSVLDGSHFAFHIKAFNRVITNPLFLITCGTHIIFTWSWGTFLLVVVDFAVDKGLEHENAVLLLSAFSAADLVGRVGSGIVSDNTSMKKRDMAFFYIMAIGVILWMLPVAETFTLLLCLTSALGLFSGGLIVLFSVLYADYCSLKYMAAALGWSSFFCGIATAPRPLIVGYFRDSPSGSYSGLFQSLAVGCVCSAVSWLAAPFAELYVLRSKNKLKIQITKLQELESEMKR